MLVCRKGNIENNFLCVTVLCTIIMVHKGMSSPYRSVDCIGLCLSVLSSESLRVFGLHGAIYIYTGPVFLRHYIYNNFFSCILLSFQ